MYLDEIKNYILKYFKKDDNLDIDKAFDVDNKNFDKILNKILGLPNNFPNNILQSPLGFKYNELEIFSSNMDSSLQGKSFFDYFSRTQTHLGKLILQNLLLNPIIDINELKKRQGFVQYFEKMNNINNCIDNICELAKIEKDVLSLLFKDTDDMKELYKIVYFENKILNWINYHDHILKYLYFFIMIFIPLYGIISPLAIIMGPFILIKYIFKINIPFNIFWNIFKNMFSGGIGLTSIIGNILKFNTQSGGGNKSNLLWLVEKIIDIINSKLGHYIYIGFIIITYLYGIYNAIQTTITYNKLINVIHNKCNLLSKWIKGCIQLFKHHGNILSKSLYDEINKLLCNNLVNILLNHNTFDKEPSLFSNKGIILKVYKEFLDMKELGLKLIEPLSEMLGTIDVWSSLGIYMKDNKLPKTYCIYLNKNEPKVNGIDVSNICCTKPIMNSFDMLDKNIMLVTGPNSSGKSTYIKSIIINIILAQTIGICSSRQFEITPFHNIMTYLNIPDCNGKESLFQAEMNRCYEQLKILEKSEKKGELTFSIMDEIFVSTNYQEGMSGFYAILKKLEKNKKCLNIITTHFDILAKMPELDVLKRYFDIDINDNGEIIRDYLVKDGVSQKHMALKLLKNKGFDPEIIHDAEFMYNKLCNNKEKDTEKICKELQKKELETISENQNKENKDL